LFSPLDVLVVDDVATKSPRSCRIEFSTGDQIRPSVVVPSNASKSRRPIASRKQNVSEKRKTALDSERGEWGDEILVLTLCRHAHLSTR
jgi:hypothetical protein